MAKGAVHTNAELSTKMCSYALLKNGILRITPKGIILDDESLNENYMMLKEFLNGRKVKVYVDNSMAQPYSRKYRLAFEKQCNEFCLAVAFTSKSTIGKVVANIFLAMTKSNVPIKMFSTEPEAMTWLLEV